MKVCLPEEVIFIEASIINDISSLSGMWKHFRVTSSAILLTIETQRGQADNWIPPFDNWIPTGMHILSHIHLEYDLLLHISIPHRYKSVYD
jgi:hypothetical protein